MDFLLEFDCVYAGKISIPFSKIYEVKPFKRELTNSMIKYQDRHDSTGTLYLKETYEEIISYIKTGKWERIK